MSKTLDEIFKAVGEEDSAVIRASISAEKDTGIESSRKKGAEILKLVTENNKLKDFLSKKLEFNLEDDLDAQLEAAQKTQEDTGAKKTELEKTVESLKKTVESLTKTVSEKDKVAIEKTEKLKNTKLAEILRKTIGEKVYASDFVIKGLIREGKVKLLDDEETAVFIQDGAEVSFDKGVETFLAANPDSVRNSNKAGGGSDGSHKGSANEKTMKRAEFDALPILEKSAKVKEGYKITD